MHRFVSIVFVAALASASACDRGSAGETPGLPEIPITVEASGYRPAEASAPAGQRVRLVFTRTTDEGCGQQLVFPGLGIREDLPLDEPVPVEVTMPPSGRIAFTCGMDMYQGAIVAR